MNRAQRANPYDQTPQISLPPGMQRSDVERLLTTNAPGLGLTSALLRCLLVMIQHTRPSDWTTCGRDPICYAAQTTIADTLGISTRAVRSAEVRLEALDLIARNVGAGGGRGRWGDFILGINFAPIIRRVDDLRAAEAARDDERRDTQVLRHQISAARRLARAAISDLLTAAPKDDALPTLLKAHGALPRRYADLAKPALEGLLDEVEALYDEASKRLSLHTDRSARSDQIFRPHIQDTIHENSCSCNDEMQTRGEPRERMLADAPNGANKSYRKDGSALTAAHKMETFGNFTPRSLYEAASEDFQFYLDAYSSSRQLDVLTFIKAATAIRGELGISPSAWAEATEEMGDIGATLSLLVIDARRFDPVQPIRSPGGMLRAFTANHRAGTLRLARSLIGLIERRRMAAKGADVHDPK